MLPIERVALARAAQDPALRALPDRLPPVILNHVAATASVMVDRAERVLVDDATGEVVAELPDNGRDDGRMAVDDAGRLVIHGGDENFGGESVLSGRGGEESPSGAAMRAMQDSIWTKSLGRAAVVPGLRLRSTDCEA
ncbi:hypothetical protein [Sorangium sp. So ce381]|uniref:hypothetical protein n=1 Tax=Sorangium sp. So ce381 TaxID=3133307 RepID=UPI003F5AF6E6